jgi:hypothetical protein
MKPNSPSSISNTDSQDKEGPDCHQHLGSLEHTVTVKSNQRGGCTHGINPERIRASEYSGNTRVQLQNLAVSDDAVTERKQREEVIVGRGSQESVLPTYTVPG